MTDDVKPYSDEELAELRLDWPFPGNISSLLSTIARLQAERDEAKAQAIECGREFATANWEIIQLCEQLAARDRELTEAKAHIEKLVEIFDEATACGDNCELATILSWVDPADLVRTRELRRAAVERAWCDAADWLQQRYCLERIPAAMREHAREMAGGKTSEAAATARGGRHLVDEPRPVSGADASKSPQLSSAPEHTSECAKPVTGAEFVQAIHEAIPDAFSELDDVLGAGAAPPEAKQGAPERAALALYSDGSVGIWLDGDNTLENTVAKVVYVRSDLAGHAEAEALRALVNALPKCEQHGRPATRAWSRGGMRYCDECGTQQHDKNERSEVPDYPRAAPLRAALALLAARDKKGPGR
jgi:hypothetical protein